MAAFDLASIDIKADSEAGSWMPIRDPRTGKAIGGDDTPARFRVLGPHSEAVQSVSQQVGKDRAKREAERTVFDGNGKVKTKGESTKGELVDDDVRVYCAAVIGWENLSFEGDEKFSTKTIDKMLRAREWLRPQLMAWIFNQENFIQGRAQS